MTHHIAVLQRSGIADGVQRWRSGRQLLRGARAIPQVEYPPSLGNTFLFYASHVNSTSCSYPVLVLREVRQLDELGFEIPKGSGKVKASGLNLPS